MDQFQITPLVNAIRTFSVKSRRLTVPFLLSISATVQAETYDFNFGQTALPTFGDATLSGSGDYQLFNFSEKFKFGNLYNPVIKNPIKNISLGDYGFVAGGIARGSSNIDYAYNFGEHNYNLDIPLSIDLNVSAIDANNQITITSAYTLGNQSAITPTVDTSNAFFNFDPTFNLSAGISAVGCVVKCTMIINEIRHINAFQENLIDIQASDLSVSFNEDSTATEVGAELSKMAGLFGVESTDTSNLGVGTLAKGFGLLELDVHTPGLAFDQTSTEHTINQNNSFELASSGEDKFFNLKVDMIDFAASAALTGKGKTALKFIDKKLSTTLGGVQLTADWELVDAEVSTSAAIKQDFGFNGTPTIQLALSDGQNLSINAGQSIVVQLADGVGSIDVNPTFGLSGDFSSKLALKLDASANLNLLGYNFDLPLSKIDVGYGFKLGNFGIGNINKYHQPTVIHEEISTEVGLYSLTRELNGFSSVAGQLITSILPDASGVGTHGNDVLRGGYGKDSLAGLGGNDVLIGGLGDDTLDGGLGTDTADYRSFTDAGGAHLQTGNGVTVNLLKDIAISNRGNITDTDTLISIENVSGSKLNDFLHGDTANNVLKGRGGNDNLRGDAGHDKIYGGNGDDFISGGNGNDILDGGNGVDRIFGGNGNDLIVASATTFASDIIDGGNGRDTIKFVGKKSNFHKKIPFLPDINFAYNTGIAVDLNAGTAELFGSPKNNGGIISLLQNFIMDSSGKVKNSPIMSIANVENIIGTDYQDIIRGSDESNIIDGGKGQDTLYGQGGDDTFVYSQGDDIYNGGAGIDTIDASHYSESVTIDQSSSIVDVENVIGSRFNDVLTGDDNNNAIDGHLGSDTIDARGGDDTIFVRNTGRATTNTIIGGAGDDAIVLSNAVEQEKVIAAYNQGNLELALASNHKVVLKDQYTNTDQATEAFNSNNNTDAVNIGGSFENLVSAGDFHRYKIESDFTTSEDMTVVTHLETQATSTFTNEHTLKNESIFASEGTLINNGTLVNSGTLIVNNTFDNNRVFENTDTGRAHYTTSNILSGIIYNDGLIDVLEGELLSITGEYYGSGFLVGDVNFNDITMNIGNSPGSTNLFGSATFSDVDFNLEIGEDEFGNIVHDYFNVYGDFTLGNNLNVTLSLLDNLTFEDLIDIDINFITVSERILNNLNVELSIADLMDYKVEIFDGFFANWGFDDNLGYSLSFNGSDLFVANGGFLPTEVPEPGTFGIFALAFSLLFSRHRKSINKLSFTSKIN